MLTFNTMYDLVSVIGSGSHDDFNTKPVNVLFGVRDMSTKRVNVSVTCDSLLENDEEFDITLSLKSNNNSLVNTGRGSSIGRIIDSTGQ